MNKKGLSIMNRVCLIAALFALLAFAAPSKAQQASDEATPLEGRWKAERRFGPEIRGTLTIKRRDGAFTAEIGGFTVPATGTGGRLGFTLPGGRGAFRVRMNPDSTKETVGHWISPRVVKAGLSEASPVTLRRIDPDTWQGQVAPLDDGLTFFIQIDHDPEVGYSAFLRNPERNLGVFYKIESAELTDGRISFDGKWRGRGENRTLLEGPFDPENETFSIAIPYWGGTYDFRRDDDDDASAFYPRGRQPGQFVYRQPPEIGDGWQTASLDDVGIDAAMIESLVQSVLLAAPESEHSSYIDGLLIARHGKLVFEEYFYGWHRDQPHDTRSASKSAASTLIGAAMHAGAPLTLDSLVYDTMFGGEQYGGEAPADLDPRAARMTLEHLLTMSSGFHCDDNDPEAPGSEERMQEQQEEPDWYRYTLGVPMAEEPGAVSVYSSSNPNLAAGMLSQATATPLEELFHEQLAAPLQVERYHLPLQPCGEPYMGGGIYWLPRDFMKLGQLMLDGGVWNGNRIISERWAADAGSPQTRIGDRGYGYLWWITEYPHADQTVTAYFAAGNGGNIVVVIPGADLVIAFFGSNYSDAALFVPQRVLIPEYILPAVSLSAE